MIQGDGDWGDGAPGLSFEVEVLVDVGCGPSAVRARDNATEDTDCRRGQEKGAVFLPRGDCDVGEGYPSSARRGRRGMRESKGEEGEQKDAGKHIAGNFKKLGKKHREMTGIEVKRLDMQ